MKLIRDIEGIFVFNETIWIIKLARIENDSCLRWVFGDIDVRSNGRVVCLDYLDSLETWLICRIEIQLVFMYMINHDRKEWVCNWREMWCHLDCIASVVPLIRNFGKRMLPISDSGSNGDIYTGISISGASSTYTVQTSVRWKPKLDSRILWVRRSRISWM